MADKAFDPLPESNILDVVSVVEMKCFMTFTTKFHSRRPVEIFGSVIVVFLAGFSLN